MSEQKKFNFDGVHLVEMKLDSTATEQKFPSLSAVDKRRIVAIEVYFDGGKSPNGANLLGATNSGAGIKGAYLTLTDTSQAIRLANFPIKRMAHNDGSSGTGSGDAPFVFPLPFPINWEASHLKVMDPGTNITSGEVCLFYIYYLNN